MTLLWYILLFSGVSLAAEPPVDAMPDTDAAPMEAPAPPEAPVPVGDSETDAAVLSSLGTGAYTAVSLVGSYAELMAHNSLDKKHAAAALGALAAAAQHQLDAIDQLTGSVEATEDLDRLRTVFEGVITQTTALQAFAEKPDAGTSKRFRDARASTWATLAEALDLTDATAERLAPGGKELGKPKGH